LEEEQDFTAKSSRKTENASSEFADIMFNHKQKKSLEVSTMRGETSVKWEHGIDPHYIYPQALMKQKEILESVKEVKQRSKKDLMSAFLLTLQNEGDKHPGIQRTSQYSKKDLILDPKVLYDTLQIQERDSRRIMYFQAGQVYGCKEITEDKMEEAGGEMGNYILVMLDFCP